MKNIKLSTPEHLHIFLSDFYNDIAYDGSPEFKDYVPKGVWITLYEDEAVAGLINLEPLNNVMWNCHVMIYETFRGNGSEEWGIQAAECMRQNLGAKKFLALTPYKAAKKYAEKIGFKYIHTLEQSVKKNGELMNQYMLEMS